MSPAATSAVAAVFGLVCGSFLNAVIHRLPRGIGLGHPRRSFCPGCGRSLPWYENLPVVSWVFLRGKCAGCHAPISARYPFVEALTALLFAWLWWTFPPALAAAYTVLVMILVAGTFIDLEHMILPDSLTLGGAAAGIVLSAVVPGMQLGGDWVERLRSSLFGAGVGFAVLFAVVELGKLAFGRKRIELSPPEDFEVQPGPHGPRLIVGGEEWDLGEVFYRPSDTLELHAPDGAIWRFTEASADKGAGGVPYAEAYGWRGSVAAAVIPREAMGFGDVKLMLALGAFLGWPGALFSIAAGSVVGSLAGVAMLLLRRLGEAGRIPFGPYLAVGALAWVAFGPELVAWYLSR